jgi:protocatechuate 3,4-dioxygenase beta subunit
MVDRTRRDLMTEQHETSFPRRAFLRLALAVPAPLALAAYGSGALGGVLGESTRWMAGQAAHAQTLPPTPACSDGADATQAQTEGPYFKRNSPERTSLLEPEMAGTRLVLSGYVLTRNCRPVAGALLDFWQADAAGAYDNQGNRLRGHQFTDESGRYDLETVVPGLYPGRTRHIHVKAQAPNQPVLTTQLYFPGEARNRNDGIFREALVMSLEDTGAGQTGTFNFVLNVG